MPTTPSGGPPHDPLTHFDARGGAQMVNVGHKDETLRQATAEASVRMEAATLRRIREGAIDKGDVLAISRIAAISAVKATSSLIPLCHPVRVTRITVDFELQDGTAERRPGLVVRVGVEAVDRTGPEMEALTGAAASALCVYDMCKAMDRAMEIEAVRLTSKSGGSRGTWQRPA